MANQIGPALPYVPNVIHTNLPTDEVQLELAIVMAIYNRFVAIPNLTDYVKIQARDRFIETESEDISQTTVPDPVTPDIPRTSVIQIGIPSVAEAEYAGDDQRTQLDLVYPISFDLEVVDSWESTDENPLHYTNSRALAMAVYMISRKSFKTNRTFGYHNCVHDYLQQENAGTLTEVDDESGGRLHIMDWSLTIHITGVFV